MASSEATQLSIRQGKSGRGARSRQLRIIAGQWRGRRLTFPAVESIRPTPDRVRETLFNWLGDSIRDARCLDLFAGSGALGLEALSRGAAEVVFVERDARAATALRTLLQEWNASNAHVERVDALIFLRGAASPFDVVFLDPPFGSPLASECMSLLHENGWLAPGARIYLECAARDPLPPLPHEWQVLRAKRAGEVGYHLLAAASAPLEKRPAMP